MIRDRVTRHLGTEVFLDRCALRCADCGTRVPWAALVRPRRSWRSTACAECAPFTDEQRLARRWDRALDIERDATLTRLLEAAWPTEQAQSN